MIQPGADIFKDEQEGGGGVTAVFCTLNQGCWSRPLLAFPAPDKFRLRLLLLLLPLYPYLKNTIKVKKALDSRKITYFTVEQ